MALFLHQPQLIGKKLRLFKVVDHCLLYTSKKAAAQIVLLMAGAAMLCFGVWRGEAATVLSKAIKLCLECVGIG